MISHLGRLPSLLPALLILSLVLIPSEGLAKKNIVICFDGTGNSPDTPETNVRRVFNALKKDGEQEVLYIDGVGTQDTPFFDSKDGTFAITITDRRDRGRDFVVPRFESGDRVYLFGFSRGATTARMLTNQLEPKIQKSIAMLGIWDTVAAVGVRGILLNVLGHPQADRLKKVGTQLAVPAGVQHVYHLVAIDEQRTPYRVTLVERRSNVNEIWFAGTHADVGGGFQDDSLAFVSLRYMINRAKKHGLRFHEERVAAFGKNADGVAGSIHSNEGNLPKSLREIVAYGSDGRQELRPRIHKSVFNRMKQNYRPENVVKLNGKYEVVE